MRALALLALLAGLAAASAAGQGLSDVPVTRVEALADAEDDRLVQLRGEITRHVRGDLYEFTDGTGHVLLRVNDGVALGRRLAPGTRVELRGEFDAKAFRAPRVEVGQLTILRNVDTEPVEPGRGHRVP